MIMQNELAAIIGKEWVREGEASAEYAVDGVLPKVVVWPGTVEEVAAILRQAYKAGWSVVPAGYGMGLSLGNVPESIDLVLSTTRLSKILDYEPADLTASVQAGCSLDRFNRTVGEHGQWLPLDPLRPDRATLGAVAAVNDFGPLRLGFGLPRDYVIGLEVVQADGRRIKTGGRVVKNVAGYDLNKLFVGSHGTLGIMTQLNLKVRPRPETEATCLIASGHTPVLDDFVKTLAVSELSPAAVESLWNKTAHRLSVPCPPVCSVMLVRFMDAEPAVRYQVRRLREIAQLHELESEELPDTLAEPLWRSIRDLSTGADANLVVRINTLPVDTEFWLLHLLWALTDQTQVLDLLTHHRSGVVRGLAWCDVTEARCKELAARLGQLRNYCRENGGSLVIQRAPVELKKYIDVWGEVGPTAEIMRALKQQFDPRRILNPGRFVAGI